MTPATIVAEGIPMEQAVGYFRRAYLVAALKANRWNACRTAAAIGVHRNTLDRHLRELGIHAAALRRAERRSVALAGGRVGQAVKTGACAVDAAAVRAAAVAGHVETNDVTRVDRRSAERAGVAQVQGARIGTGAAGHPGSVAQRCRGALSVRERRAVVQYLSAHRWPGAQRAIARRLGVAPSTISRVWRQRG